MENLVALFHTEILAGVYLHDPTTLIAAVNPSLMTYTEGVVRVQTVGITKGLTVFDNTKKRFVATAYITFKLCTVFIMENSIRYTGFAGTGRSQPGRACRP